MHSAKPNRILIVRLSALGDVIQTLPVLDIIKNNNPDFFIGWLVEEDAASILEGHYKINQLHVSHRKRWLKSLKHPLLWKKTIKEIFVFFDNIRQQRYEAGLDFQGLLKSSLTLFFTGIRNRIGYSGAREGASIFYTKRVSLSKKELFNHSVPIINHFKALLKSINIETGVLTSYLLPVDKASENKIENILISLPIKYSPVIILAPATKWSSKHWPMTHWRDLAQELLNQTSAQLIWVGSSQDIDLIAHLTQPCKDTYKGRMFNLAGVIGLKELAALLKKSTIVIGSDSAPLHLAGSTEGNAILIGLYGPTSPLRTPPPCASERMLLFSSTLPCQPCHKKVCPLKTTECMKSITPDTVLKAVLSSL